MPNYSLFVSLQDDYIDPEDDNYIDPSEKGTVNKILKNLKFYF